MKMKIDKESGVVEAFFPVQGIWIFDQQLKKILGAAVVSWQSHDRRIMVS
jgi:hypothetical protein